MGNSYAYYRIYIRKTSWKRLVHLAGNRISHALSSLTKKPFVWGMPSVLTIEPTSLCNLRCPECPSGSDRLSRKRGRVDPELFRKIIDEAHPFVTSLTLYFQGEPLLHPDLFDLASYACKKKLVVHVATNAQFLDSENAARAVDSGIDHIIVSVDGLEQADYAEYRVGGEIQKVWTGIQQLDRARREKKSARPFITAQVLVLKSNENHLEEIKNKALQCGADRVVFKTAQFYDPDERGGLIPENNRWSRYRRDNTGWFVLQKSLRNRCRRLWTNPVITWDGYLLPCCFDKDAEKPFGNLQRDSLREIWKGAPMMRFRAEILKSRKNVHICRNCTE